ncbi:hypothetical protein LCGC14_0598400 [marine sediment metagenome]|uniref:Uncharacterized protein n=1 Tax=marine sediment metagenome TaxID=412755 RepID=A0A0F9RG70_9ZZZZ
MVERRYRRYYISAGGTFVALFLALQLWGLQIVDVSGDVYCTDTCTSYFSVRNPTYRSIYIYNRNEIKLDFVPEIKDYQLYVKYYRKWVPMDFTMETRLGNVPKDRKYVFVFPRYSIKHFKLVGKKDAWKDIKWTFGTPFEELDPLWISAVQVGDKIVKENCIPIYKEIIQKIPHYKRCNVVCVAENKTCTPYDYDCFDYLETIKLIEQVDCQKTGTVNVSGTIYSYENHFCKLEGNQICCIDNKEGGQFNTFKKDLSVDGFCDDLVSEKRTRANSLKTGLKVKDEI